MAGSGWSARVSTARSRTLDSGQRVSGTRSRDQPLDQRRVLHAAQPVVDALDPEDVERLGDVLGRALLAGVRDLPQPERRGGLVHLAELRPADARPRPSRGRRR